MPRLPLALLLLASPLAAQGFEGTVSMRMTGGPTSVITWFFKGPLSATSIAARLDSATKPISRELIDNSGLTSTVLLPASATISAVTNGTIGFKLISDLKKVTQHIDSSGALAAPPKRLGTSQTIAGMQCDDYELSDSAKTRACLTKTLGQFVFPPVASLSMGSAGIALLPPKPAQERKQVAEQKALIVGGPDSVVAKGLMTVEQYVKSLPEIRITTLENGKYAEQGKYTELAAPGSASRAGDGLLAYGSCATPPSWAIAIGDAGFPLKVWTAAGKPILEVTKIQAGAVQDNLFMIPDGYHDVDSYIGLVVLKGCGN